MRYWWLLASLLSLIGGGVLLAWPAQPAWRVKVDGMEGFQSHFLSSDGERLYGYFDRQQRKYEIATTTGIVKDSWVEPGIFGGNMVHLEDVGYVPLNVQLLASPARQQLRILHMKSDHSLYVLDLQGEKLSIIGWMCNKNLVAINLHFHDALDRNDFLAGRRAVLIDLQHKKHHIIAGHIIMGIADFHRIVVDGPERTWGVLDLSTQQPMLAIPGENIIAIEPHGDRFRLMTTKVGEGLSFRLTRYEWQPGLAPTRLAVSESHPANAFNLLAFTIRDGDTFRRNVPGTYPFPFMKEIAGWLKMDDTFETWEQRDFSTGQVKCSWSMRTVSRDSQVLFHANSRRAYFTDKDGYLTAWDLPPRRLTGWVYACLALSALFLVLFVFHRRLFQRRPPAYDPGKTP